MQVDAWRQKLPKMCSIWRTLVIFPIFRDRFIKVSSFCPPEKYDFFPANFKFFCVRMDARRCLKAKSAENVFTLTKFGFFPLLCFKVIKVPFGHRQKLAFLAKIEYFGREWMQLDRSALKLTKMCSLWQFLVIFPVLCYRFIKGSSFWSPT